MLTSSAWGEPLREGFRFNLSMEEGLHVSKGRRSVQLELEMQPPAPDHLGWASGWDLLGPERRKPSTSYLERTWRPSRGVFDLLGPITAMLEPLTARAPPYRPRVGG